MRYIFLADEKIAPSRKCASYRNEATNQTLLNNRSLMNQQCVCDSGELATRSSRNSGSIKSGLRSVPRTVRRRYHQP